MTSQTTPAADELDIAGGSDEIPECEGHESLRGEDMGVSVFCPNNECVSRKRAAYILRLRQSEAAFRVEKPSTIIGADGAGTAADILDVYAWRAGDEGRHAAAVVTVAWSGKGGGHHPYSSHILVWQEDIPRWVLWAGRYFTELANARSDALSRTP